MKRSIALYFATAGFIAMGALPAHAATPSPTPSTSSDVSTSLAKDDFDLQKKIDAHIAKYGGKQKGKNQIEWPGTTMTFPIPKRHGDVSTYARAHCYDGRYCVYEHALWDREGGRMQAFYQYGKYNLENYGWPYRQVSALENNQTGGAWGFLTDEYDSTGRYLIHQSRGWYKADGLADWRNDKATHVTLSS